MQKHEHVSLSREAEATTPAKDKSIYNVYIYDLVMVEGCAAALV